MPTGRFNKAFGIAAGLLAASLCSGLLAGEPVGEPLFLSGEGGYQSYRIPALAVTTNGTVLAFCEGRKRSASDTGDIDLLLKRSRDHGRTWSAPQVIWDDAANTCGNPCVVVDRDTGTIWLLSTWNRGDDHEGAIIAQTSKDTRRVFVLQSADDGQDLERAARTHLGREADELDLVCHRSGQRHPAPARSASGPPGDPLRPYRGRIQALLFPHHLFG